MFFEKILRLFNYNKIIDGKFNDEIQKLIISFGLNWSKLDRPHMGVGVKIYNHGDASQRRAKIS